MIASGADRNVDASRRRELQGRRRVTLMSNQSGDHGIIIVHYARSSARSTARSRAVKRARRPGTFDRPARRNVTAIAEVSRLSRRRSGRRVSREIGLGVRAIVQRTVLGTPRVDVRSRSRVHRRRVASWMHQTGRQVPRSATRRPARGVRDGGDAIAVSKGREAPTNTSFLDELRNLLPVVGHLSTSHCPTMHAG